MAQFSDIDKRRIRFQTRRGLLELDLILKKFMAKQFDHLNDDELTIFVAILALEDQEFLAMINQIQSPTHPDFEPILTKIRGV